MWGSLTYTDKCLSSQFCGISNLLIENNVDIFTKNNLDLSALDLAICERNYELAIDIITTVDTVFTQKKN